MRRTAFTLTLASLLLLSAGGAGAAPMAPKINQPESYHDFRFGLDEMRQNIDSVTCGGWHTNPESAGVNGTDAWGEMPYPFISKDVPGRENKMPAMSKATTGLDERTDFDFPNSAFGYLSACMLYDETKHDPDLERMGLNLVFDPVDDPDADPNPRVEAGDGTVSINPGHWCIRMDKATPRWCEKLFKTWKRMAEIAPRPFSDAFCICPPDALWCPSGPPKRYCFDYAAAAPHQEQVEPTGQVGVIESADYTKTCSGQECRTPWAPLHENALIKCEWGIPQFDPDGNYIGQIPSKVWDGYDVGKNSSFYRHYGNPFSDWTETKQASQTPLTIDTPTFQWKVRADCYEYYQAHLDYPGGNQWKELDPKDYVTSSYDEQCEFTILTNDEQNPEKPQWKDGGPNGEKQKDQVKAPPFDVQEPPREPRPTPEPWVTDSETNLSLIDMKKLKEDQADFEDPSDINGILGTILTTRQRASKTLPKNARSDQFDDSDHRALAEFWEAQQRELLKMTADPQTRLIMPARFLVGIAEDDPIFQYVQAAVTTANGDVNITIRAGAEDLENVLQSFTRIFIAPIREVRAPVLVPLASTTEIDDLIFEWQQWKKGEDRSAASTTPPRPSKSGQADPIIAKLIQYRDNLDRVRLGRVALQKELTRMYATQETIRTYFADWFKDQTAQFLLAIQRAEQRRDLKIIWRLLQRSMLQTDECQMQYCSNQRYSTPIYSLLDNWWGDPSIQPGQDRDPDYVPPFDLRSLGYVQPSDQVFDFSNMKFSREPLLIPVLWPVAVKITLPSPPLFGSDAPDPNEFPDLAPVPDETVFDSFPMPDADLTSKPTVSLPPTPDLTAAEDLLRKIRKIVDGTEIADQMIEEDEIRAGESIDDGGFPPPGLQPNRLSMRSAYCRFQPSIVTKPDPEQKHGKAAKIIHTEDDLKERLGRLFARWLPERTEDMAGRVARLNEDFPTPDVQPNCKEDVVCYLLPPEVTNETIWQWFMPTTGAGNTTGIAGAWRGNTLPPDDDHNPYKEKASIDALKRMFSELSLPWGFDLSPSAP